MRCHPSVSGHIRFSANEQRDQHCINALSTPDRRLILGYSWDTCTENPSIPNIPCEIHCKYLQCMATTHPYLPFPVPWATRRVPHRASPQPSVSASGGRCTLRPMRRSAALVLRGSKSSVKRPKTELPYLAVESLKANRVEVWLIQTLGNDRQCICTAKHLVLPAPVGPPSSYELKTWLKNG